MTDPVREIADRLGYRFNDPALLELALTHGSSVKAGSPSNGRLEHLGDAVLGLAVGEALYRLFPQATQGRLSQLKASIVNNERLAEAARRTELGAYLRLGKGEELIGGRDKVRALSNGFEALLGAVYLDGGIEAAKAVVGCTVLRDVVIDGQCVEAVSSNSKSALQEWLQARGRDLPHYALLSETGPSHQRQFRIEVRCGAQSARGEGPRKQVAEETAAGRILVKLIAAENESVEPARAGRSQG